jgi:hypothetical protein
MVYKCVETFVVKDLMSSIQLFKGPPKTFGSFLSYFVTWSPSNISGFGVQEYGFYSNLQIPRIMMV